MRSLATLLVALVLALSLGVAAFAGLHAVRGPVTETAAPGSGRVELPAPFVIEPGPLDHSRRRLTRVVDANHALRHTLRILAEPDQSGRLISLWQPGSASPPLAIEKLGADGTATFEGLRPGSYLVRCQGATEIEVRLEADAEVDLRPPATGPRTITIVIEQPSGMEPLAKARLLVERDGHFVTQGETDAAGRVALRGVHGKFAYRVWASLPEDVSQVREWRGETEALGTGELTLRLRPQDAR